MITELYREIQKTELPEIARLAENGGNVTPTFCP